MYRSFNQKDSERGTTKHSHDDHMNFAPQLVPDDSYPKNAPQIGTDSYHNTTRDLTVQSITINSPLDRKAVNAAKSPQTRLHAELDYPQTLQEYIKPPPNHFVHAVPPVREDEITYATADTDSRYGGFAPNSQTSTNNRYFEVHQPIRSTSTLASHPYHVGHSDFGGRLQLQPGSPASSKIATPISTHHHRSTLSLPAMNTLAQYAAYTIEGDRQRWLAATLEANILPNTRKTHWLFLPELIWDLHSLTPAQRVDRYVEMTDFGRILDGSQISHGDPHIWKIIQEASDSLKRGEIEWYNSFWSTPGTADDQIQRLQVALLRDQSQIQVTQEEVLMASRARNETLIEVSSQLPQMPVTTTDGETVHLETSSHHMMSSANIATRNRRNIPDNKVVGPTQQEFGAGKKRPMSDDDAETSENKKARSDSLERHKQEYDDNKPAIDHWWLAQQKSSKAPWFERLMSWKASRNYTRWRVQQRSSKSANSGEIRKLGVRKHPKDKVNVTKAKWPAEDSIANSSKRGDGMYSCMHVDGTFDCCKAGLTEKKKKASIHNQIRGFKSRVEDMIVNKDLHVAHKTWNNWVSDKKFKQLHAGKIATIDARLALVHDRAQPARAPAAPTAPQAIPLEKIVAAFKQREKQKHAAAVSSTAPMIAPNDSQQPQAPSAAVTSQSSQQQTGVQLPRLAAGMNHAVESNCVSIPITPSLCMKTGGSSISPFMPLSPKSEVAKPTVDYRQVAMKMFQQLIKDQEPIVLPGLRITRKDITTDMNGCVRRLTLALETQAEEASRSGSEDAAQPEDRDDNFAMPGGIANGHDSLETLSNDEAGDVANEDKEYLRWHLPSSTADHDEALRADLGAWAGFSLPPGFSINPQFICQNAIEEPLPPGEVIEQPQLTDAKYPDVPDNWYMDDPSKVIDSGPVDQWSTQSTFSLEDLSYFDLDKMTPSDLQDRLRAIKDEREHRETQGEV